MERSLDTICAALCGIIGIEAPAQAHEGHPELLAAANEWFSGRKADRLFMYNPDAVARWIFEKYPKFTEEAVKYTQLQVPLRTVMPSVTPVCFGTMYTGAQPEVHGIRKYMKPVIKIDSIFDSLIRAGRKPVIVAQTNCSMSMIYLERDMDYFIYPTIEETNAKAAELILEDKYDAYFVYNGNYDHWMHKYGPEDPFPLGELRCNSEAFGMFAQLIKNHWQKHDTLIGFAMDHGCHEIDGGNGSHGLDMDEDIQITHLYAGYPKAE